MDEEYTDGQNKGNAHPEQLFAVLAGEVENGGMVLVVAGGIDVNPAKQDKEEIEAYRYPVVPFLLG
jgi:hypothetical protein